MRVALIASAESVENAFSLTAERFDELHDENTGNVAFVNAIHSHLRKPVAVVPWHTPAARLRDIADIVVLACADQLCKHVDTGRSVKIWQE